MLALCKVALTNLNIDPVYRGRGPLRIRMHMTRERVLGHTFQPLAYAAQVMCLRVAHFYLSTVVNLVLILSLAVPTCW